MAQFQCPHCEQPVSETATQCPNCSNQIISAARHNRSGRFALTAMWICIIGTLFSMLSAPYSNFYLYYKQTSLTFESYALWFEDHVLELTIFNLIGVLSTIIIAISWLLWISREKKRNAANIIGIALCVLKMCIKAISYILAGVGGVVFHNLHINTTDIVTFYTIFPNVTIIVTYLLSIALGITIFFIENTGKVKKLANITGVLFIVCYAYSLVFFISTIAHPEYYTLPVRIINELLYCGLLIMSIVLFYKTYRQTRVQQQA